MKTSDSMTLFFRAAKQLGNLTPRDIWRILRVIEIAWNQLPSHPSIFDAESLDCHLEILKRALMLIPARPNQPKAKTWWPVREKTHSCIPYCFIKHAFWKAQEEQVKKKKTLFEHETWKRPKKNTCNGKKTHDTLFSNESSSSSSSSSSSFLEVHQPLIFRVFKTQASHQKPWTVHWSLDLLNGK